MKEGFSMGTRCDFWLGRDPAVWLGSVAWSGEPSCMPDSVLQAGTEGEFVRAVFDFLPTRVDATLCCNGWPWPWKTGDGTDFSITFADSEVLACHFGGGWRRVSAPDVEDVYPASTFPDMSDRMNVRKDVGSGILLVGQEGRVVNIMLDEARDGPPELRDGYFDTPGIVIELQERMKADDH
jgi:hypothetical protein